LSRLLSAHAEKRFGSIDAVGFAKELKGDPTITLFQDNSKGIEVMTFQSPPNIGFCLANQFSFNPARFETDFQANHPKKKARSEPELAM
jgi:hypothetical protein